MAESKSYSAGDIMSMQNDAIRRVHEMQRRSQEKLMQSHGQQYNQTNPLNFQPQSSQPNPQGAKHVEHNHEPPPQQQNSGGFLSSLFGGGQNALTGILDKLHLDSEIIVILLLMLVLANEGADMLLLLALVYIML